MSTELSEVTNAVAEFDRVAAGLAELQSKYKGVVYEVATTKGMKEAIEARRAVREPRIEVEKIRKAAKAPILALGKRLDSEAARITKVLEEIEAPIDEQIRTEELRKEAEKAARIAAEMQRVSDLQERVAQLRGCPNLTASSGSELIAGHIADLEKLPVDESFEEFRQQAEDAKAAGLSRLRELHAAALAHEAEQARIQAEREELARLRAEQTRREAEERARIAEEERQAKIAREAEAARQAEQLRRQREEEAQAAAARQAIIDAENARSARIAAERRAQLDAEEAQARAAREAQEAAIEAQRAEQAKEAQRLADERAAFEREQREAREAEERRIREAAEAAARRERAEQERRKRNEEVSKLTAEDIVRWIASEYGCEWAPVAERIASIPHEDWVTLSMTEQTEEAA